MAQEVGIGAVIFHDLKNNRRNAVDFKLEDVVKFEGDTGPYVQYAHARAESLIRKGGVKNLADADLGELGDDEWGVVSLLGEYDDAVKRAAINYDPSVVAKYALKLAKRLNQYYAHHRILDDAKDQPTRLAMVQAVSNVLKDALSLLDVKAPDEM